MAGVRAAVIDYVGTNGRNLVPCVVGAPCPWFVGFTNVGDEPVDIVVVHGSKQVATVPRVAPGSHGYALYVAEPCSSPGNASTIVMIKDAAMGNMLDARTVVYKCLDAPHGRITKLALSPTKVHAGDLVTATYSVEAPSDAPLKSFLRIVDETGATLASKALNLEPGQSVADDTLSFNAPERYSEHSVTALLTTQGQLDGSTYLGVYSYGGTTSYTVEWDGSRPEPRFVIKRIDSPPNAVKPQQRFMVAVLVSNAGGAAGSADVILYRVGEKRYQRIRLNIDSGSDAPAVFTVTAPPEPGLYRYMAAVYDPVWMRSDDYRSFTVNVSAQTGAASGATCRDGFMVAGVCIPYWLAAVAAAVVLLGMTGEGRR